MNEYESRLRDKLTRPIVLTGMMGAGKTKLGTILAAALTIPFIDSDHEIEEAAGRTIAEIFEEYGEPAFRDLERRVLARLLSGDVAVISTGGGAVMNPDTETLIREKSISLWLDAPVETLVRRTANAHDRPLLKSGDPHVILSGLLDRRRETYARADVRIDTDGEDAHAVVQTILKALDQII
jgi:shikimate kinase